MALQLLQNLISTYQNNLETINIEEHYGINGSVVIENVQLTRIEQEMTFDEAVILCR